MGASLQGRISGKKKQGRGGENIAGKIFLKGWEETINNNRGGRDKKKKVNRARREQV